MNENILSMNNNVTEKIKTTKELYPQIYAYILPDVESLKGWVKIGYTERENVEDRIKEQVHTAAVENKTLWFKEAKTEDGHWFKDHDLHKYLTKIKRLERKKGHEWFFFGEGNEHKALEYFYDYIGHDYEQALGENEYLLRDEQREAVEKTLAYMEHGGIPEFLWNAKPRFGKTLTSYDLARQMEAKKVLIITNRPAIGNSWFDDFEKFIAWQTDYKFVSDSDSLKNRAVISYKEYESQKDKNDDMIAFVSLADLKGAISFGGEYDKLKWVKDNDWDLLIIDEAHEAIDTFKTDLAFDNLNRKFTLHLSGTPFKAVANGKFDSDQIYNWTYQEEQEAKMSWDREEENPYAPLPTLNMLSYRMSDAITESVKSGADFNGQSMDYTFDLNEFFSTKNGKFIYEDDVRKWLDTLTKNTKYPFSTKQLRNELKHTFWFLQRVDSAKALKTLLEDHPTFENYKVVLAAGDGKSESDDEDEVVSMKAIDKVKQAIEENDKTITLSVGQLTTGVTIPEWTAVLMLSNLSSPSVYMQAAFRAQNPWTYEEKGKMKQKENAYVFDFSPSRTLTIYDEFANNLSYSTSNGKGTREEREENIQELINFFPVIAEDENGVMHELSVDEVLTIPSEIKASEVVKRGFMSNLLFQNISAIFKNPQAKEIFDRMTKAKDNFRAKNNKPIETDGIQVDEDSEDVLLDNDEIVAETEELFGNKVYTNTVSTLTSNSNLLEDNKEELLKQEFEKQVSEKLKEKATEKGIQGKDVDKLIKESSEIILSEFTKLQKQAKIEKREIELEFQEKLKENQDNSTEIEEQAKQKLEEVEENLKKTLEEKLPEQMKLATEKAMEKIEKKHKVVSKKEAEDEVKSRLRGFARTIPMFLMAYGKEDTTLANFDSILNEDTFLEMTGITIDDFKLLRDTYQFFDESVFNSSVQEFLNNKVKLANYLEHKEEDIFDYIPPQQTNQIFTPKWIASYQLDLLEEENPDIFKDKTKTFCDLYMKSGTYLAEVVKRLFVGLKDEFPNENDRIKHILENQVYGFAPTEIIFNITKNYIFGIIDDVDVEKTNIVQENILPLLRKKDGIDFWSDSVSHFNMNNVSNEGDNEMKFDVILGNPPYQDGKQQVYPYFFDFSKKVSRIVSLIFPSGWQEPKSTNGLGIMNNKETKYDKQIVFIDNLVDVFEGITGAKNVNIIEWKLNYDNGLENKQWVSEFGEDRQEVELKLKPDTSKKPKEILELAKVVEDDNFVSLSDSISPLWPYGLMANVRKELNKSNVKVSSEPNAKSDVPLLTQEGGSQEWVYVENKDNLPRVSPTFNHYQVLVPKAWGAMSGTNGELSGSFSKVSVIAPNSACSGTWIVSGAFDNKEEAILHGKFMMTKFFRALLFVHKKSHNTPRSSYAAIPKQDYSESWWSKSIAEIDEHLFEKYNVPENLRQFVRDNLLERDETLIEDLTKE